MGSNFFIRTVRLPEAVRAVTLPNEDGTFDIYINAGLPQELQAQALAHELTHIRRDHFYSPAPVSQNEQEANGSLPTGSHPAKASAV